MHLLLNLVQAIKILAGHDVGRGARQQNPTTFLLLAGCGGRGNKIYLTPFLLLASYDAGSSGGATKRTPLHF
jgi:hypothetical protein